MNEKQSHVNNRNCRVFYANLLPTFGAKKKTELTEIFGKMIFFAFFTHVLLFSSVFLLALVESFALLMNEKQSHVNNRNCQVFYAHLVPTFGAKKKTELTEIFGKPHSSTSWFSMLHYPHMIIWMLLNTLEYIFLMLF